MNVDLPDNTWDVRPDIEADITKPLPFDADSAKEIHAYHVIEHFYPWQVEEILSDWKRVLRPGGVLVLECPCLDKIVTNFTQFPKPRMAMFGLYGDPKYKSPEMMHKWCYSFDSMEKLLTAVGFVGVDVSKEVRTHIPARDMRAEAFKP